MSQKDLKVFHNFPFQLSISHTKAVIQAALIPVSVDSAYGMWDFILHDSGQPPLFSS